MKKIIIIIVTVIVVISCNKKSTPAASNSSGNVSNEKVVVGSTNESINNSRTESTTNSAPASQGARAETKATATNSPEQLGQATYNAKCGRCHGLKVTTDYTVSRWATVMQVMAIKANLSEEEKQNVLAYVNANAKKG
jgi:cytochrome c553